MRKVSEEKEGGREGAGHFGLGSPGPLKVLMGFSLVRGQEAAWSYSSLGVVLAERR